MSEKERERERKRERERERGRKHDKRENQFAYCRMLKIINKKRIK